MISRLFIQAKLLYLLIHNTFLSSTSITIATIIPSPIPNPLFPSYSSHSSPMSSSGSQSTTIGSSECPKHSFKYYCGASGVQIEHIKGQCQHNGGNKTCAPVDKGAHPGALDNGVSLTPCGKGGCVTCSTSCLFRNLN